MGYTDAPPGWWREFILASPARTAKLAVVRADGSPHVAPVWADLDGDQVVFMTSADTVKGKVILRDPRVPLCWDDERPPFRFVRPSPTRSPRRTAGRSSWRSPAPAATGPSCARRWASCSPATRW